MRLKPYMQGAQKDEKQRKSIHNPEHQEGKEAMRIGEVSMRKGAR